MSKQVISLDDVLSQCESSMFAKCSGLSLVDASRFVGGFGSGQTDTYFLRVKRNALPSPVVAAASSPSQRSYASYTTISDTKTVPLLTWTSDTRHRSSSTSIMQAAGRSS